MDWMLMLFSWSVATLLYINPIKKDWRLFSWGVATLLCMGPVGKASFLYYLCFYVLEWQSDGFAKFCVDTFSIVVFLSYPCFLLITMSVYYYKWIEYQRGKELVKTFSDYESRPMLNHDRTHRRHEE